MAGKNVEGSMKHVGQSVEGSMKHVGQSVEGSGKHVGQSVEGSGKHGGQSVMDTCGQFDLDTDRIRDGERLWRRKGSAIWHGFTVGLYYLQPPFCFYTLQGKRMGWHSGMRYIFIRLL